MCVEYLSTSDNQFGYSNHYTTLTHLHIERMYSLLQNYKDKSVVVVVIVVRVGDPCESPGALLLTAAPGDQSV